MTGNGQGIFHNSANNRERWSRKSDCVTPCKSVVRWHVIKYQTKNCVNYQSAFWTKSTFYTRSAVGNLHFLLTGLVLLFLFEQASSSDRNIRARKHFLVRLSWPLWLMCGLYVEELPKYCTMIKQWLLYSNWRRTYNDRAMITLFQLKTNVQW